MTTLNRFDFLKKNLEHLLEKAPEKCFQLAPEAMN